MRPDLLVLEQKFAREPAVMRVGLREVESPGKVVKPKKKFTTKLSKFVNRAEIQAEQMKEEL